jgi:hypothetical protein
MTGQGLGAEAELDGCVAGRYAAVVNGIGQGTGGDEVLDLVDRDGFGL